MALAVFVGRVAVRWIPVRRKVAEENLKIAFPELGTADRKKLLTQSYTTLIAGFLDMLAMCRSSKDEIIAGVQQPLIGGSKLDELRKAKKGFIIVSAHTGSWEWGGAYLASIGVDLADVAKPLQNPAADRFAAGLRGRFGIKMISTQDSSIRMVRHLKNGGALSLLSDQNARKGGIFVPFFGRAASTVTGAGYLAYRLGVPVLPVFGFRTDDGHIQGFVDDPIWADSSKPLASEVERITKKHVESLERFIRIHPGQYFWFHRRWKTRPPVEAFAGA